jgi:signal transduction histidine kinase
VLGALVLSTATLGFLSIQAVRREAIARRNLLEDTYRGVADLVSARLDAALASDEQAIRDAVAASGAPGGSLVRALGELEDARPWLRPLVIVAGESTPSAPAPEFDAWLASAEREELALRRVDAAVALYTKAASAAPAAARRLEALNGLARAELNAGRARRAADVYRQIVTSADLSDAEQARWAVIAHERLVACAGDNEGRRREALNASALLIRLRFVPLDTNTVAFYARLASEAIGEEALSSAEQEAERRIREVDAAVSALDAEEVERAGSAATAMPVAYPLRVHIQATLGTLLDEPGPWSDRGIALADGSGVQMWPSGEAVPADATGASATLARLANWRVQAFPASGSMADLAAQEVNRYAIWLLLMFATVVGALALAARSVSRELMLARLRAEFVAGVSHELKTPLALIRMFAESLQEGWVPDSRKKEYYEVITRESERLTGLINNVLDFSRLESGTRRYAFESVDLRGLVQDLLDRYEFHLRAARIDLVRSLPAEPVQARVDRGAIEQVLVNLLSNAVKYMGDGSEQRRATVSLERRGARVVLRVADTGIGMAGLDRARIFDQFYRADDERVRAVAGSGLGLTLVKAHVDAHGGTIDVDSTPGRGSAFTITLQGCAA